MSILRILLATDLSASGPALAAVASLASSDPLVECVLVHALQPGRGVIDLERVEAECRRLGEDLRALGARVSETLVLRIAGPEALIGETVRELDAALVVLGVGPRGLGSTLRGAIRSAAYPVLLLGANCAEIPIASLGELHHIDEASAPANLRVCDLRDEPPLVRLTRVKQALIKFTPTDALLLRIEGKERLETSGAPIQRTVTGTARSRGSPRPGAVA